MSNICKNSIDNEPKYLYHIRENILYISGAIKMDAVKHFSKATLRRLPGYLHLIARFQREGHESISTTDIAREMRLDPTQVRKDFAVTEIHGKPKIGYQISELIDAIEKFLGWKNSTDAFLVGAGSLGTALLGYSRLKNYGLNIIAAFDVDREKIGRKIHGKEVLHLAKLPELVRRMHVSIGIITAPAEAAQTIADLMIEGGIIAIWNFSPTELRVPENIIIQKAELYASLALLSKKIDERYAQSEAG